MKIRLLRLLVILLAAALWTPAVAAPAPAVPGKWEQVDTAEEVFGDEVRVEVRDNYVYVSLARPAVVKIFTILGQPVAQSSLPAGTSRFRLTTRGIYILKLGTTTRRITI